MSDNARRHETIEYINGEPIARLDGVPDAGGWVKAYRDVLREARLDATAKVIYLLILDECGRTGQHTVQYPYGRIEQEVSISRNTIRKKLIQLQDAGFLEVSGDEGRASGHTERWYTPTPPGEISFYRRVTPTYAHNARMLAQGKMRIPGVQRDRGDAQRPHHADAEIEGRSVTNCVEADEELHSKEETTADLRNTQRTEDCGAVEVAPLSAVGHIDLDELRDFLGEEMFAHYLQEESARLT
jgi:predicted ArsR family transcriptional regulator